MTDADTTDPDATTDPDETDADTDTTIPVGSDDPFDQLARADQLCIEADEALASGELGEYQNLVEEARELIRQAVLTLESG